MNIINRQNRTGDKIVSYYDFGRQPGQRLLTDVFIYQKPEIEGICDVKVVHH